MSADSYFIIAFIIIISPFLLIFFRTFFFPLCERLFRLCHVQVYIYSYVQLYPNDNLFLFCAKRMCAATGGKRIPKMFRLLKFQSTFKP